MMAQTQGEQAEEEQAENVAQAEALVLWAAAGEDEEVWRGRPRPRKVSR
jgi:hypothetical protein